MHNSVDQVIQLYVVYFHRVIQSLESRPVRPRAPAEGECKTMRSICLLKRTAEKTRGGAPSPHVPVSRPI